MGTILGVEEEFFYKDLMPSVSCPTNSKYSLVIVDCDVVDFERTVGAYIEENELVQVRRYRNNGSAMELIFETAGGRKIYFAMAKNMNGSQRMRGYRFSSITYTRGEVYRGY